MTYNIFIYTLIANTSKATEFLSFENLCGISIWCIILNELSLKVERR